MRAGASLRHRAQADRAQATARRTCEAGRSPSSHSGLTRDAAVADARGRNEDGEAERRRTKQADAELRPGSTARALPSAHPEPREHRREGDDEQRVAATGTSCSGRSSRRSTLRVLRSANRFSVEPACSNTDQKSAGREEEHADRRSRRLRSAGVQSPPRNSQAKKPRPSTSRRVPGGVGDLRGRDRQRAGVERQRRTATMQTTATPPP